MSDLTSTLIRERAHVTFTVGQVLEMEARGLLPNDRRVELVGGELLAMPLPGPAHVYAVTMLQRLFNTFNAEGRLLVQQALVLDALELRSPDLMVLHRPLRAGDDLPDAGDVALVIEVSDSTLRYDRMEKLPLYLRSGVPEVWLVNLQDRVVELYQFPRVIPTRVVTPGERIEFGDAAWFDVAELFT